MTAEDDKKTLGDYHDIYLKTDVLLLADNFKNIQENCLRHYKLDPTQFYRATRVA